MMALVAYRMGDRRLVRDLLRHPRIFRLAFPSFSSLSFAPAPMGPLHPTLPICLGHRPRGHPPGIRR